MVRVRRFAILIALLSLGIILAPTSIIEEWTTKLLILSLLPFWAIIACARALYELIEKWQPRMTNKVRTGRNSIVVIGNNNKVKKSSRKLRLT